jgi:hypothetical protein
VAVLSPRQARHHGLSAAGQAPMGVTVDFWHGKNRLGSTRATFHGLLSCSPHCSDHCSTSAGAGFVSSSGAGGFEGALAPGLVKTNKVRPLTSSAKLNATLLVKASAKT